VRWRLAAGLALGFTALLAAFAKWVVAPAALERITVSRLDERTRSRWEVRDVSVGWRTAEVRGVSVADATGRRWAFADRAVVRFDRPLWIGEAPRAESVRVSGAEISATLDPDGQWDVQRFLSSPGPASSGAALDEIAFDDCRLVVTTRWGRATAADVSARLRIDALRTVVERAEGRAFGGRAAVSGWFGRHASGDWTLQLNAQDFDVATIAKGTSLAGRRLTGKLDGFANLDRLSDARPLGAGWIDVREGRLYELPMILSIFNILSFEAPGEAVLHTARCDFRVHSDRTEIGRLQFLSRGPCLYGSGSVRHETGEIDFEFVPRLSGTAPEGLGDIEDSAAPIGDFITRNFLVSVEVKGTWLAPKAAVVPVRVISKPLKEFFRLLGASDDE
jgi:hypothetical protein